MKQGARLKSGGSLEERRRKFIFKDEQHFRPVERQNIRGIDITLQELDKIIERIRSFQAGVDIGGGVLLYGDIGTGKTHGALYIITSTRDCARAVDLRKFPRATVDGREVPLTAEDVHAAYAIAGEYVKKHRRPILLVYDNVEVTEPEEEGTTEFDTMVEQLLIELSGTGERVNGIYIILTSTYSPSQINPALFRPGRIGDQIGFGELTPKGQLELLRYAFKEYRPPGEKFVIELEYEGDLDDIAYLLENHENFNTPAAILDGFRQAVVLAAHREQKKDRITIGSRHLLAEAKRLITGQLSEESMDRESEEIAAYHEAGHAVIAHALGLTVRYVTILPGFKSLAGGTTGLLLRRVIETEEHRRKYLIFALGGKTAEELFGYHGVLAHGSDTHKMTAQILDWVKNLGGGLEFREHYGYLVDNPDLHQPSEVVKRIIENDAAAIIKNIEKESRAFIEQIGKEIVKERIQKIAAALLEEKILLRRRIEAMLAK